MKSGDDNSSSTISPSDILNRAIVFATDFSRANGPATDFAEAFQAILGLHTAKPAWFG